MKSDIEISNDAIKKPISEIAREFGIDEEVLVPYGKYVAKIPYDYRGIHSKEDSKLILVTAMTPTKSGEGKTTVTIGIADALHRMGKNVVACLRQPSMGPVFGMKGGACGGGYSQVIPMDKINLGLTGDFDAVTNANNLLASMIDNHIYQGNKLNIDPDRIVWKRCIDINDRSLRNITVGKGKKSDGVEHEAHFDITAASEIMSILVLSRDFDELRSNLGNIIVAYTYEGNPIYARELNACGSMVAILKDAFNPNLLQTLEGTPVLMHGGPFANISLGTNTIVDTLLGMRCSDYVITEAGFGADLGAEKFLDIKCKRANISPHAVVVVATIKALKYHGEGSISKGVSNLIKHIDNLRINLNQKVIVALNKFDTDKESEIDELKKILNKIGINTIICDSFINGSMNLVNEIEPLIDMCNSPKSTLTHLYRSTNTIKCRILSVASDIYGASRIEYTEEAERKIEELEKIDYSNIPICIAKTQYSFSDNPSLLNAPRNFTLTISDIEYKSGAGLIVVKCGKIMTMPGLPEIPNAMNIDVVDGRIIGIN